MQSVLKTGKDLEATVPREDAAAIRSQCSELKSAWDSVQGLSEKKAQRLEGALKEVWFSSQFVFCAFRNRI